MIAKIKVYGKAQNRTVLGIVHAYVVMYPHATLEDLRKAFPNSLCPDKGVEENFLPVKEALKFNEKTNLYFAKDDELIKLADGSKIALSQIWSKSSFDKLVQQGSLYDIVVAEFEKTMRGEKGGFRLEYLNGYVPPVATQGHSRWWLWLIILLLVIGVLLALFLPRNEKTIEVEKEVVQQVEKEVIQQIEKIEYTFNAVQFEQGKSELKDEAKRILEDLAKVLKENPALRLRVEGHTSVEGEVDFNQKLSEDRAQVIVDFLVNNKGIDISRLQPVGVGSSQLKDPENPTSAVNRRTEFEVI